MRSPSFSGGGLKRHTSSIKEGSRGRTSSTSTSALAGAGNQGTWLNTSDDTLPELQKNWANTYNSLGYQIPILNLFYAFIDEGTEPPSWSQVDKLMQNMSIVSALVLALAITFHSSVTFDEFNLNDARYQRFEDDGVTPLGWRPVGDILLNDGYASWWYGTGNEGGTQKGKTVTMTQQFNYNMVLSICFLTVCLLSSVMVLVSATTTAIARPSANVSGHQYRTVMRAYMRGYCGLGVFKIILVVVFSAVLGVVFFFESIKTMTYLKFPDEWVENTRNTQTFGFAKSSTTYGFADAIMVWLVYFALVAFMTIMSLGQRAAYCYPMKPVTVLGKARKEEELRGQHRAELTLFLAKSCHIPTCENESLDDIEDGSKLFSFKQQAFLTNVGGGHVNEAEVIADALLDAGIMSIFDFKTFVDEGEGMVFDCPGISIGAATQISWEFQFGKARHDVACFDFLYGKIAEKYGKTYRSDHLEKLELLHDEATKNEEGGKFKKLRSQLEAHLKETLHINTHEKWLDDIVEQLSSLIQIGKHQLPETLNVKQTLSTTPNPGFGI